MEAVVKNKKMNAIASLPNVSISKPAVDRYICVFECLFY